jgi:hypothetical protein
MRNVIDKFNKMMPRKLSSINHIASSLITSRINSKQLIYKRDLSKRSIYLYKLNDVVIHGESIFYPDIRFYSRSDCNVYNPIDEEVMSLKSATQSHLEDNKVITPLVNYYECPVFYFIYNTDNYYHFIYDTLPYLISYLHLLQSLPEAKLLVSCPNYQSLRPYPFFYEFLEMLDIKKDNLVFIKENTIYSELYLSDSYTHAGKSDFPPHSQVYGLYDRLRTQALRDNIEPILSDKIYVSRRSWLHNNKSNIGTDYTSRRVMENEDELMDFLFAQGFVEIFAETLSTSTKINLFYRARFIIGALGGGLSNALFSTPSASLIAINSPSFLDVNHRFIYSLNRANVYIFHDTAHAELTTYKKFMRVSIPKLGIIGEVESRSGEYLTVAFSKKKLAGWNATLSLDQVTVHERECLPLDNGLNSAWRIDIEKFKHRFFQIVHRSS